MATATRGLKKLKENVASFGLADNQQLKDCIKEYKMVQLRYTFLSCLPPFALTIRFRSG